MARVRRVREAPVAYDQPAVLCDVNVLIALARQDHPHHQIATTALERHLRAGGRWAHASSLLAATVRITTNPRAFVHPSSVADVVALVDAWLALPSTVRIEPGPRAWVLLRDLLASTGAQGGAVSDLQHAALAIEHGCGFWTFDRDFDRIPGLRLTRLTP